MVLTDFSTACAGPPRSECCRRRVVRWQTCRWDPCWAEMITLTIVRAFGGPCSLDLLAFLRETLSMRIVEISHDECKELLNRVSVGRLACSVESQPYVVPSASPTNL